jgi:hypothetical protein
LRDDPNLRRQVRENGLIRAKESDPARLAAVWRDFITDIAFPAYERWSSASDLVRQTFLKRRYFAIKTNLIQEKMGLLTVPEIERLRIG